MLSYLLSHYKYGTSQQEVVYSTYKKNEPLEFTLGFGEHWKAFDLGKLNLFKNKKNVFFSDGNQEVSALD
jgi:Rps23 Pro-64 3,4-dihydroxylase Tpa1-like proline 4-hydroxylase